MENQGLLIRGARLVDPSQKLDARRELYLLDGKVAAIGESLGDTVPAGTPVLDAGGLTAAPGLVDMHVHFRDPGQTHKEDILSGSRAAAAGGVTSVACMPNTRPPVDNPETVSYIRQKGAEALCRVYPVACISAGQQGERLTDFAALRAAGAVAVSDDGRPVKNAALMQQAIALGRSLRLPVISHCEDLDIIGGGIVHKGKISQRLGVPGMDRSSEDSITAREIALADSEGAAVHIAHVSTRGSAEIIRDAKRRGIRVTAETAPHYLLFTDEALLSRNANFRMNPPLRDEQDRLAMLEAVANGAIDCIVTDHAPHAPQEKADFATAPNGIVGLETSLAASITALVETNTISLSRLVRLMSCNPAKILGIPGGSLAVGSAADLVLFDPKKSWVVTREDLKGRSANSPFLGKKLTGQVQYTLLGGRLVFQR